MKLLVPPPIVAFCIAIIIWLVRNSFSVLSLNFTGQLMVAFIVALAGLLLAVFSMGLFWRSGTTVTPLNPNKTSSLVVSGFYRFTRNPMYLGMAIMLMGWSIYCGNLLGMVGVGLFVSYMNKFQIEPEEKILKDKFGEEFTAYCSQVRRWI